MNVVTEFEVLEFIHRRFKNDCDWTTGNCYYFAVILKSRFPEGDIVYDTVRGHFMFMICGRYFDYFGVVNIESDCDKIIPWSSFDSYDKYQKDIIRRDCIL